MATEGWSDYVNRGIQHPNPLFDYMTTFVPRKLKTLFQYCEYLYFNSPQIFAAITKFACYPVTDIKYGTDNDRIRTQYQKLLEDTLKLKAILIRTGIDRHVYGNSFISIHFPFKRFLRCSCGYEESVRTLKYKFTIKGKKYQFRFNCPKCGARSVVAKVIDRRQRLAKGINIIRWDPKIMDINHNPITGEMEYFLEIPPEFKQRIRKGDRHVLNTTPLPFIDTIARRRLFKFAPGKIYHMKTDAPAGVENRWGFPSLTATIKKFFHAALLHKANEAISLEFIVPFRVLHPAQSTVSSDPTITISLSNWVSETKMNMRAWRQDPLHLMFSPIPMGVTQLGGQGRALMVTGEIVEMENAIIAAMGIPREFLYGGLSATGSGVTLRMLENQLLTYTTELTDEAQWIANQCAKFLGYKKVKIEMEPFKLVDDVQQKMMILQAYQLSGGQLYSLSSLAKLFGTTLNKERDLRMQETLDESREQYKMQGELQKEQSSLAARAQMAEQTGQAQPYNPQEVIAQADTLVQYLMQMQEGQRRSYMHQLQMEDFVMYSVVVQRLEVFQTEQGAQARAEMTTTGMPGA